MSQRKDIDFLKDILNSIKLIKSYSKDISEKEQIEHSLESRIEDKFNKIAYELTHKDKSETGEIIYNFKLGMPLADNFQDFSFEKSFSWNYNFNRNLEMKTGFSVLSTYTQKNRKRIDWELKYREKNNFRLEGEWAQTNDTPDINFKYTYSVPFQIPTGYTCDVSRISGYILNENDSGISDIRVNLGDYSVFTDKNGFFEFPPVNSETVYLTICEKNLDSGLILIPGNSVKINPEKGENKELIFRGYRSAELAGTIKIKERDQSLLDNSLLSYSIDERELREKLLVKAVSEHKTYYTRPDDSGYFEFENIYEADWKIKLLPGNFKDKLKFNPLEKKVVGEADFINFTAVPRQRQVEMKPGGVIENK